MTPSRALWIKGLLVLTFCPGLRADIVSMMLVWRGGDCVHGRHGARRLRLGRTRRHLNEAHSAGATRRSVTLFPCTLSDATYRQLPAMLRRSW